MIAFPKPRRGEYVLKRKAKRKAIESFEDLQKAKVRARDKKCRWPHCRHKGLILEAAHLRAKGMGGDHGTVSNDYDLILLCRAHHQWDPQEGHPEGSIERHTLRIEPLTDQGSNGPVKFLRQFIRLRKDGTGLEEYWLEVGKERAVGILETR